MTETETEFFCNDTHEHPAHSTGLHPFSRRPTRCDGVTKEEEAVMAVVVENGYAVAGTLDRDDARAVIAALDAARGNT